MPTLIKKASLVFLAIASLVILATFFVSHDAAQIVFALVAVAFPIVLIAVGASKNGRLGPIALPLLMLLLLQLGCVIGMICLRGGVLTNPWVGGLPLSGALQLYVAWLLPLVLVSLAYGLTFRNFSLTEQDLEKLKKFEQENRST